MSLEHLEWLADLMNVELYDLLQGQINTNILHQVHPKDYDAVAKVHRICKNSVKMEKIKEAK